VLRRARKKEERGLACEKSLDGGGKKRLFHQRAGRREWGETQGGRVNYSEDGQAGKLITCAKKRKKRTEKTPWRRRGPLPSISKKKSSAEKDRRPSPLEKRAHSG